MIPNRPSLDDLAGMEITAIAALPPDLLALLATEAEEALERAKRLKERLEAGMDQRYRDRAAHARRADGRNTGTVRLDDGEFIIVADLPKRVRWDQAKLAAIVEQIRAAGEDPGEYVVFEQKVAERAYSAWPESIRSAFTPARTVEAGKPTYRIEPRKETR